MDDRATVVRDALTRLRELGVPESALAPIERYAEPESVATQTSRLFDEHTKANPEHGWDYGKGRCACGWFPNRCHYAEQEAADSSGEWPVVQT